MLEGLHGATQGNGWTNATHWLDATIALNDWYGVEADAADVVERLWLHGNGLAGTIPGALGELASLNTVNLGQNQLTGEIPAGLGDAISLEVVFLQRNQLSGEIPAELGDLTSATLINLSRNQLTGAIPAELGDLVGLETLNLRDNELEGALPVELKEMSSLEHFYVVNNSSLCRPDDDGFTAWLEGIARTDAMDLPICEPPAPQPLHECTDGTAGDYPCDDLDLLAHMALSDFGAYAMANDLWGWVDPVTGTEWVLAGHAAGTAFISLADPYNPFYAAVLPRTSGSSVSAWRDIKVYDDHAFIVSEASGHGMQVLDLTQLRNLTETPQTLTATTYSQFSRAHNIVINTESGFAYAVGVNGGESCNSGLHMIDLSNPGSPTFAGCFHDPATGNPAGYTHDAVCVDYDGPDAEYAGKEICFASNETALSVADVTDKDSATVISSATYPNVAYTHQAWIDDEHEYLYMNDELDEIAGYANKTRTLIWDVKDLDDPIMVAEYLGTTPATDHNIYIVDDLMYQSNYLAGLRVVDISSRENPHEVAYFDPVPHTNQPGSGYPTGAGIRGRLGVMGRPGTGATGLSAAGWQRAGSWSNYPYFASGVIVFSDMSGGLFFVRDSDQQ